MEGSIIHKTEAGTPQGGICSPTLANLTLDGIEAELQAVYPKQTRKGRIAKVNMVRYADDLVITGASKELLENEVKPLIERFLAERGLELSQEKTKITHIADGFDFLGQNVRKYNGTLLIKPSHKNVRAFLQKVREVIKANAQATTSNLIRQLNPLIRGWANYHRHVVSKRTFAAVDHAIYKTLWNWAKRRHPTKPRRWIRKTYFHTIGGRNWVFCGEGQGKDGKPIKLRLFSAAQVPIQRHTKIKGAANPYDPAWEPYFEHRLGVKMAEDLRGRRKLLYLWKEQQGVCPVCKQPITMLTGWHNHHIVWRVHGGSDRAENRVLLHPNCHVQVHHQGLTVVKPRPLQGV
jgi:RNA-directed DNA polymerase